VLDTDYATDDEALIAGVDPNRPAEQSAVSSAARIC
jgi:hypothetical protein